jgi:phospholipase/carboxylesterase
MTLDIHAEWRRAPKSGPHTPVVVVLHGRGADEHDLLPVIDRLPRRLTYVSIRAFVDVEGGGYTWFENRGPARPIARSVRSSIAALRAWLDEAAPPPAPLYLLGFSAGMMMAGALVLDDPRRFAGAILLSGALPLDSGLPALPGRLAGLPVLYGRGVLDDVIPPVLVGQTERYLRDRSGAEFTLREYEHAHSISLAEMHDIAGWLDSR